jgi:hypothetical protein
LGAIVDSSTGELKGSRGSDFADSLGQVVAELRLRGAWLGHQSVFLVDQSRLCRGYVAVSQQLDVQGYFI